MKHLNNLQKVLTLTLLVLLSWQARYIFHQNMLNGFSWEVGTFSVYAVDVLIFIILLISAPNILYKRPVLTSERIRFLLLILVWILFLLISIIFSLAPSLSNIGVFQLFIGLAFFYTMATTRLSLKAILISFSIGVLLSSIFGLVQFFTQNITAHTLLGISGTAASLLGASVVEFAGGRFLRTYGTLSHPNVFGGFVALGTLTLIFLTLTVREWKIRIPTLASIPLFLFILLTTASRSAILGFLISSIFFFIALLLRDIFTEKKRLIKVFAVFSISLVLFSMLLLPILSPRVISEGALEERSHSERIHSYFIWPRITNDDTLFGLGPNVYRYALALNDDFSEPGWAYQPVHSSYLLIIGELGIIGAALFSLFFIQMTPYLRASNQKKDVSTYFFLSILIFLSITALFDHYWWSSHFGLLLLFFMLGIIYRHSVLSKKA